ncbi:MAG: hypothetical protein QM784_30125 [Polyangiaceae bacterium]
MWIWIVAVVLLICVWGGSFLLGLLSVDVPIVYRVLGTIAVVLLVAGVLGFRWLRARARAKALERENPEAIRASSFPGSTGEARRDLRALRQISQGIQGAAANEARHQARKERSLRPALVRHHRTAGLR